MGVNLRYRGEPNRLPGVFSVRIHTTKTINPKTGIKIWLNESIWPVNSWDWKSTRDHKKSKKRTP